MAFFINLFKLGNLILVNQGCILSGGKGSMTIGIFHMSCGGIELFSFDPLFLVLERGNGPILICFVCTLYNIGLFRW